MGEAQFSPEGVGGPFSFKVGGEGFGFEGGLTEGKFTGMIRGADGKEFAGLVEDLGGGRYKVEDWEGGRIIESPAEALAAEPAEIPVVGLEDATAVVAMEAMPAVPTMPAEVTAPAPEAAAAVELSSPAPEPEAAPIPSPILEQPPRSESSEAGSMHPVIGSTINRLQEIRREVAPQAEEAKRFVAVEKEAKDLRRKAEEVRSSINRLRNKDKISARIAEESALILQAKELEDKVGIARSQDKYKEMDEHKAWRLEARKDATIALEADLKQWETVMRNPADFNFYRQVFEKWQQEGGNTGSLVSRVDQEFRPILDRFEQRLPRRLLELAGFVNSRPEGGQKGVDDDIWAIYNQTISQLYSELGGQPAAVTELPAMPEPVLPPGQGIEVQPPVEAEQAPGQIVGLPTEEVLPPTPTPMEETSAAETEAAPEPKEAPMSGGIVVDAAEQARAAAARPVEAAGEVPPAEAVAETPAQPEVELTPDQIWERAERRKNNFAGAVLQLEVAYVDASGTKNERVGRVVDGVRGMILAGLELAEEGGAAQEVVINVLGRLNNEQNRLLVQAAVGQVPELVEQAVGNTLRARGAFGSDGKPKSRKELEDAGLVGLIELLLQLGMSFTDASINAVITEVQSVTGAGR